MNTFLPYPSFVESARCLDYRRLGKQRVEAKQILEAIEKGPGAGWYNHPCTQQWIGHTRWLLSYAKDICQEWINRGYKDNLLQWFRDFDYMSMPDTDIMLPSWLGNEKFHASHRSNLLRKDPEFYGKYGWIEPNDLPYYWPSKEL